MTRPNNSSGNSDETTRMLSLPHPEEYPGDCTPVKHQAPMHVSDCTEADTKSRPGPEGATVAASAFAANPGAALMRLLHEDGGGKSHVPPEYAQQLARLCDVGHPLAMWAARYMAIKVCGRSPNTVAAKGRDLATFIKWFVGEHGHGDVESWIERDTRRFLNALERDGKKPATINRHLYTIGHFARWVHAQPGAVFARFGLPVQEIEPMPVEDPACQKLSSAELEALFTAAHRAVDEQKYSGVRSRARPRRNLALLGVLYYTGVRISEALSLKRQQYDGVHLFDVKCKGRRTRKLVLHPECIRLMDHYIEWERIWDATDADDAGDVGTVGAAHAILPDAARPLFMARGGASLDRRGANRMLEKLGKTAGEVEGKTIALHAHRLRHTFGARYREASGSDTETATALGHAGLGYVGRYVRQSDVERSAILAEALRFGSPEAKLP